MRGWLLQSKRIIADSISSIAMILFSLFCLTTGYAQDWQKVSPDPFLQIMRGIFFIDANTGWACGENGVIYNTTDAGTTWASQPSGVAVNLHKLFFLSATDGYVCGTGGTILHTTDGGTSWTAQTSNTAQNLNDIHFLTVNKGFAVGNGGKYAATTDGGTNWTVYTNGTANFYAIDFADANIGVMVGSNGDLYRTTDAGDTWGVGENSESLTNDVTFATSTVGYLVGINGKIRKTTDAGDTWSPQISGTIGNLIAVTCTDANNGHASSTAGELFNTTDGGANWTASSNSFSNGVYDLHFTSASIGYGLGGLGVYVKTTDSGIGWTLLSEGVFEGSCISIAFPSSLAAYMTSKNALGDGYVWKSTDGGQFWEKIIGTGIDPTFDLNSCDFVNANTGWVTAADNLNLKGEMYKTTDGGASWTRQTASSTFLQLYSAAFFDANSGWACGADYQVIRTTDGGATWATVNPVIGTGVYLIGIAALDASTAIVIGSDYAGLDVVYKTTDGGANWTPKTCNGVTYMGLAMSTPSIGAIFDGNGDIYRTTDGGETWSSTPVASTATYLLNVTFNGSVGIVVGDNGYVGKSTDAGATWTPQNSGTTNQLRDVSLQGDEGLISGNAIILKNEIANPMPVELVSFTAHAVSGGITLAWETATEIDNYGFDVERASLLEGANNFKTIGFVIGNGNSNSPKQYSFFDASVPSGTNVYRLKQIDNSGTYEYSQEIEAAGVIESFELSQNIPNPFNPETEIYYTAAEPSLVRLQVYSVTGELVETLVDKAQEAGAYTVNFGGKDLAGGVYLYTLSASPLNGAAPVTITKKMVLLK